MPEKLILEGNLYVGEIIAEIVYGGEIPLDNGKYEYGFRPYHYFGSGVVKDKRSGSRYNFALTGSSEPFGQQGTFTQRRRFHRDFFGDSSRSEPVTSSGPKSLEETILCLKSPREGYIIVPIQEALPEFIDFTLAKSVDEVASSKDAIPIIYRPTKVNPCELISRGYCQLEEERKVA